MASAAECVLTSEALLGHILSFLAVLHGRRDAAQVCKEWLLNCNRLVKVCVRLLLAAALTCPTPLKRVVLDRPALSDHEFSSLELALHASMPGDTIVLPAGRHSLPEAAVELSHSVRLRADPGGRGKVEVVGGPALFRVTRGTLRLEKLALRARAPSSAASVDAVVPLALLASGQSARLCLVQCDVEAPTSCCAGAESSASLR